MTEDNIHTLSEYREVGWMATWRLHQYILCPCNPKVLLMHRTLKEKHGNQQPQTLDLQPVIPQI